MCHPTQSPLFAMRCGRYRLVVSSCKNQGVWIGITKFFYRWSLVVVVLTYCLVAHNKYDTFYFAYLSFILYTVHNCLIYTHSNLVNLLIWIKVVILFSDYIRVLSFPFILNCVVLYTPNIVMFLKILDSLSFLLLWFAISFILFHTLLLYVISLFDQSPFLC